MFIFFIIFYLSYIGINTLLFEFISKLISHKKYSIYIDGDKLNLYSSLILFVGLPILLFRKKIIQKRKYDYFKMVLNELSKIDPDYDYRQDLFIPSFINNLSDNEIINIKRKMKLINLKEKVNK